MAVIDFHSHILPGMDDGARNIDSALAMLEQIQTQQIDIMAATPHFYASKDRIDTFLKKRETARDVFFHAISEHQMNAVPQILL